MSSEIIVDNISLDFRLYHTGGKSLKEHFLSLPYKKKRQPAYSNFLALKNVNFSLVEGNRVGVIGRNGAGKSTLLKAICGIYQPSKGQISVKGRIAPLLEIGAGFHPEFTGRENIYLNGAILGYTKKELKQLEAEVIEFAELQEFIDIQVKYYSTGMYMRLAFSLATTISPEILILDEMLAVGDASFVKKAQERMNAMIQQAKIMVFVSHDHSLLGSLCNRFIWLDHGNVVADGDHMVLNQYQNT